jgi:hypothetical protein
MNFANILPVVQGTIFYFVCPYCKSGLERPYNPYDKVHCAVCNKSFHKEEGKIVPDMFSLAKKELKDIADIFCDRWSPKTAFIYPDFAVLEFEDNDKLDQMCTYIDNHEVMFNGLDFHTDEKTHLMLRRSEEVITP